MTKLTAYLDDNTGQWLMQIAEEDAKGNISAVLQEMLSHLRQLDVKTQARRAPRRARRIA